MADLFDVIADPTRRELLRALLEQAEADGPGEASVGELVNRLSLSQPTVSKHLKTLREFSIVSVREQGQHRFYRLEPSRLEPIAEWLGAFVKPSVTEQPATEQTAAVAAAAPAKPLPPRVRAAAVRLGASAAGLTTRFRRAS
ncbi:metalloregulator ArsR/SmtB family transcription factor [Amnibacterium sp. CER49]|uniref:ArsR/SmtB family transcription factor n=1 Tax=Amnibacterium sp. CER49 TaxID=3039161 RepID=UPI00244C6BBD|nr:metalloregulator ArsR/SmtB family transcription factor [Amnibacterium sp. CER49]MDH2443426.1 metalloregulator ArsR/SmtB family transcription factor [Amnibacterium sp. CER49]